MAARAVRYSDPIVARAHTETSTVFDSHRRRATTNAAGKAARAAILIVSLAAAACARGGVADSPLAGGAASLEALADSAWAAVVRADTAAMERLRLTEQEHNEHVWPQLPAADPAAGFPVDLAWENISMRDAAARMRLLGRFERAELSVQDVACEGEQRFEGFRVLTDCAVHLHDPATGSVTPFQLFRDVVVRGGTHKIFRYYFDGE